MEMQCELKQQQTHAKHILSSCIIPSKMHEGQHILTKALWDVLTVNEGSGPLGSELLNIILAQI